jgi:hypothetical protein
MKMRKIVLLTALLPLLGGCDEQRDLYDTSNAVMHIEGSWARSLNQPGMMDATALLYKDGGIQKEILSRPNGATAPVTRGDYDVVLFNGVMESEQELNLNHVHFRGTDRLETFEVYAAEGRPNSRLTRVEGEYIASNEMELFTFGHTRVSVDRDREYYLKYKDGRNGYPEMENYVAATVEMEPRAMSFRFQVRLTNLVNPRSVRSVSAALRGFVGSVYLPKDGERPKAGISATHHVTLSPPPGSRTRAEDGLEIGTLQSPPFVTFGPRLPEDGDPAGLPARGEYFLDPVFVLTDGTEYRPGEPIDITAQINGAVGRICEHHSSDSRTDIAQDENLFELTIDSPIVLPTPAAGGAQVDVTPWEDDEVVIIWVGRDGKVD